MDEKSIKQVTDKVTEILIKKNQNYGGASFDLGLYGNVVHLFRMNTRQVLGNHQKNNWLA